LREYSTTYIDPLVALLTDFADVPVTLVIEPDSLPNLATNVGDPRCGNVATATAYKSGVAYAVQQLATKTGAVIYIDGAHGGWLGWQDNAQAFAEMINEMNVASHIRGFALNVANYQPLGHTVCKPSVAFDSDAIYKYCSLDDGKADPCCEDACGVATEWNSGVTELNYVAILSRAMSVEIKGFEPRFVIDTGRNGVADMRADCFNWCNIRDAGVGQLPTAQGLPDPRIDALFWLKTPGESDGTDALLFRLTGWCVCWIGDLVAWLEANLYVMRYHSIPLGYGNPLTNRCMHPSRNAVGCTETLPNGDRCPRFDSMCGSDDSLGSMGAEPRAPEAGHWFEYQILQLAANANLDGGFASDPATTPVAAGSTTVPSDDGGGGGDDGSSSCVGAFGQCGGNDHAGPTCCVVGYSCQFGNEWYSQCVAA
jgi:cellulase/cellobiase CelA1